MPFVPVTETALAELVFLEDNQVTENTLYFHAEGSAWDATSLTELANNLREWWYFNLAPLVSPAVILAETRASDLTDEAGTSVAIGTGLVLGGSATGAPLPNNVAACVSFRTQFRGRSYRGRNYVGGLTSEQVVGNTLTPEYMNGVIAAYQVLLDSPLLPSTSWVVASRYSGGVPRGTGITTPVLSVGFADNIVDSQRRRLPGRGR